MRNIHFLQRLFYSCLFLPAFCPRKIPFSEYNVQQGLIQSQVLAITQDHFDNLWFGTSQWHLTLRRKSIYQLQRNRRASEQLCQLFWLIMIQTYGLAPLTNFRFNGQTFKNIRLSDKPSENAVRSIQEDGQHRVSALMGGKLYRIDQDAKPVRKDVTGSYERITAIQVDRQGILWAAVMSQGIFRQDKQSWKNEITMPEHNEMGICQKIVFDQNDSNRLYLLTYNSLISVNRGGLKTFPCRQHGKF
jgi:ligand-binding sensor domain-containing protein